MGIEIRLLKSDELDKANKLYSTVYKKERSYDHFIWEFLHGPAGEAIYIGAFDGDRLVGTQAAIPLFFIDGKGSRILTAKSEDTLLDPEYRGRGLFDKMYTVLFDKCKEKGIAAIWGFTYAKKPFLKIGFEIPFETNNSILVFEPIKAYKYLSSLNQQNKFKEKLLIFGLSWYSYIKNALNIKYHVDHSMKVYFNEVSDLENLSIKILADEHSQTLLQNREYLKWRIDLNPYENSYKEALLIDGKNDKLASVIFNLRQDGIAYIEQVLVLKDISDNHKRGFICEVIREIKRSGATIIRFWGMTGSQYNQREIDLLSRCGFKFTRRGTAFVYKKLNSSALIGDRLVVSRLFTQGNM
jgi:GNAT superfamily N-acetyltransferase